MLKILLADNHVLFREALAQLLAVLDKELDVIQTNTAEEAIAAAAYYNNFDLIILNQSATTLDIFSAINQLRISASGTPVVVITSSSSKIDIPRVLKAGAASYIPKATSAQEFLFALKQVLKGTPYLPANLLEYMTPNKQLSLQPEQAKIEKITTKQKEVLKLLSQGLSNKGIAKELHLSEGTIKLHVSAIMRALGVRNRTEAAMFASSLY
jgi:DNA-binding NarL/FixJ family response regulator